MRQCGDGFILMDLQKSLWAHPGSARSCGKTTTMTISLFTLMRYLQQRLVVMVVDRCELLQQLMATSEPLVEVNQWPWWVIRCYEATTN